MINSTDTSSVQSAEQIITEWRAEVMQVILRAASVLGLFAVAGASYDVINRGLGYLAYIYIGVYAVLLIITYVKLPYWLRAGFFLLLLYFISVMDIYEGGLRGDSRLFLLTFVVMTVTLFGAQVGWAAFGLMIATLAITGLLVQSGAISLLNSEMNISNTGWVTGSVILIVLTGVVVAGVVLLERYIRLAQIREGLARERLVKGQVDLERRIEERTRALQSSFQVSQRLTTILDPDLLITTVVDEVGEAFGYYHTQIYLWDARREYLEMRGGTGSAGRTLVTRKHRVIKGRGLVGRAAEQKKAMLASDTASSIDWIPNPLLPDTRAEVAVPILSGGEVLGVLDVQSNKLEGLNQQDVLLIQALSNQVGVTLENARRYVQTQRQAEREAQANLVYQKLQTAAGVEEVLQIAAQELGTALSADSARVQIGMRRTEVKG